MKHLLMTSTALLLTAGMAFAQIEEVIVTAQKRAESIQDVPISMAALSRGDLDALEIKRVYMGMVFL